jgi:23S rRNA pseudouridine2605 synthase
MPIERLQRIIARSGLCSRREADELIREGRVTVNGHVAKPGDKADASTDAVKVDGHRIKPPQAARYILLFKPRQVMSTCSDPEGRTTVVDLVRPAVRERVFPIGRLDYHSEGLIILTSDGDLAERVAHPRYGMVREYRVKIRGDLSEAEETRLMKGAVVDGRKVRPIAAWRDGRTPKGNATWWRVQLGEGRSHEVRELFFRTGHPVQRLRRVAIGPIRDDAMKPGEFRPLTADEIEALRQPAARSPAASPKTARRKRPRMRSKHK